MPRKDANVPPTTAKAQQEQVVDPIENYELPKSLVTKIAKSAIPENTKLSKETVLAMVKGTSVFINYLSQTAHDVAASKQHKTIAPADVLKALELIEFGDLVEVLEAELEAYKADQKKTAGKKVAAAPSGSTSKPTTKTGLTLHLKGPAPPKAAAPVAVASNRDAPMDVDGTSEPDFDDASSHRETVDDEESDAEGTPDDMAIDEPAAGKGKGKSVAP